MLNIAELHFEETIEKIRKFSCDFIHITSRPRKLPIFFQLFLQNAALQISNIEYLGILLSFYSVIFISIELSYPKISSCRHGIINILLLFEIIFHKILNKYLRKCSRRGSLCNRPGPLKKIVFLE